MNGCSSAAGDPPVTGFQPVTRFEPVPRRTETSTSPGRRLTLVVSGFYDKYSIEIPFRRSIGGVFFDAK
ncbi:MAG: hypothetical protein JO336_15675 [Acidobacteriia bacterium]|nr:hypothetical protein [Terriglobia bacterium]